MKAFPNVMRRSPFSKKNLPFGTFPYKIDKERLLLS